MFAGSDARVIAEKIIWQAKGIYLHRRHHAECRHILLGLERAGIRVAPAVRKQAEEYATEALGWRGYAPWLNVYSAIAGRFRTGWIPENYYGRVVLPPMKGQYGKISDLKPLSRRLFASDAFPDVAYVVNGLIVSREGTPVARHDLHRILFERSGRAVFKLDHSIQGRGVEVLERESFDAASVDLHRNGVFQSYIDQHEGLAELSPNSVATLRLTTAVTNAGVPSLRAAYLRLARIGEKHVKSGTAVRVSVDLQDGQLYEHGYLTDWMRTDTHPDTHIRFLGRCIPAFRECVSTALDLQARMPFARCVGWDLSVDRYEKVQIIEWNGWHNSVGFSEATQGPCFADLEWDRLWRK